MSLANPNARHNCDGGHYFPVTDDATNAGHAVKELIAHTHPSQTALFCHRLNEREKKQYIRAGHPHVLFNPNRKVGKNTIGKYLPELCCAAGVKDWRHKTPHTLRQWYITTIANNPNVNAQQVAAMARHSTVSAQQAYIRTNAHSHVQGVNALLNPTTAPMIAPTNEQNGRAASFALNVPQANLPLTIHPSMVPTDEYTRLAQPLPYGGYHSTLDMSLDANTMATQAAILANYRLLNRGNMTNVPHPFASIPPMLGTNSRVPTAPDNRMALWHAIMGNDHEECLFGNSGNANNPNGAPRAP